MSMPTQAAPAPPVAPSVTPPGQVEKPKAWQLLLMAPSVGLLLFWMIVPLAMTIIFSFRRFNLLNPDVHGFAGIDNYKFLWEDESFYPAILNTIIIIAAVLVITVVLGVLLAVLYDKDFWGKNVASLLVIAPFFVMPTVAALVWKNMIMHPVYGLIALALRAVGLPAIDWFGTYPLVSVIIIIAWEWLPFAFLILYTSIKSLDTEQKEAASIDGANPWQMFWFITLPHLQRSIGVVVMIETIFLLSIFAEIYTTTSGGPGHATTNLAYLVYSLGLQQFDVGIASAGGILAVILANIVATFLVRLMAQNLKGR
jgi:sorbitol/mannitol transport system permease protein